MLLGLDLRLWLMILGPVFIGVILLQGYFRVRGKKGDEIQLSLDKNYKSGLGENDDIDELSLLKAELPNGGARIVSPPEQTSMSLDVPISAKPETVQKSAKPLKRTKKAREIPMLMELADNQNIDEPPVQTSLSMNLLLEEAVGENQISSAGSEQEVDSDSTMTSESAEEASSDFKIVPEQKQEPETSFTMPPEPEPEPEPESEPGFTIPSEPVQASGPDFTISSEPEQEPEPGFTIPSEPEQEPEPNFTISSEPDQEPEPDSSISISSEPDREVQVSRNVDYSTIEKLVIVYVMAKQGNFSGEELRQVLQDNGMVYGDMKIFHRMSREGLSEFSLSSAVEPGFFDIARMDNLQTPGVIMFLRVHELADPMSVYGEMMNVAISIAEKLDGVVLDETRNSMTMQTIEYCKQSIRDFQFRHSA
ncbi:MAG: hypothetical protein OXC84_01835 [Gammaproteobacteria bacterium]|nr:hypothetical protein [Gammaproteobacteria bacterium]